MKNKKIGIIFDSSCGFKKEKILEDKNFFMPIMVEIDGEEYKSGIDLDNKILFKKFGEVKKPFKTSAINLNDFVQVIEEGLKNHDELLVITISQHISSTNRNLKHFVNIEPKYKDKVTVYESNFLTPWIQFMYNELLEMQKYEKIEMKNMIDFLDFYNTKQKGYLAPSNLERLYIGGRLSEIQYKLAKALKIFPIIEIINGDLSNAKVIKVRKKEKIILKLTELLIKQIKELKENSVKEEDIRVLYINNESDIEVKALISNVEKEFIKVDSEALLSPEINAHVGEGAYGIGAIQYKNWKNFIK